MLSDGKDDKDPCYSAGRLGSELVRSHDGAAAGYSAQAPPPAAEREAAGPVERAPPDQGASPSPVGPWSL